MSKLKYTLIAFALWLAPYGQAQLIINEIMQSNIDCIMDDLNEFPDSWVELYNSGAEVADLSEYALGDSDQESDSYTLPSRRINPGEYVIIFCDKVGDGLHTPFRLDSGKGGSIYLFHSGEIIDKIENWKKQPAPNIAFGRENDGSDKWGYQENPTPGARNCGRIVKEILEEPVFSHTGRVASTPFSLALSVPEGSPAGTEIRYTTDGTEPTKQSKQYAGSININGTTVVRAKLFCDGYMSPRSTAQSYIFFPRDMTMPVVSIVCDPRYFYDDKIGIYSDANYTPDTKNYEYDWRRPVNIEYFEQAEKPSVINQLCETRVKGNTSRVYKLKSLVIYANKRFGTKRFEHEFFPDQAPDMTDWKSLELRNSGGDFDFLYFRDALVQRMMGLHADLDWQPYQPTIIMINGEYKGMLNLRSRANEDLIYTMYDGEEDIDLIENWWELKAGDWDNFNAFRKFYTEEGHTYAEFEQWMDIHEFANFMIMNLFYDNKDFPGNNFVCWRPRKEGGKWRWIAKDTDFGVGLADAPYDYKTFDWFYSNDYDQKYNWANGEQYTRLFRRLMDTPEFHDMFIDMCAVYMGDFMNAAGTIAEIDRIYDGIKYEYPFHRRLFNELWPKYDQELTKAKTWITNRTPFFYQHLADFYQLGTPREVKIDAGRTDEIKLTVNGTPLFGRTFDGKFFENRELRVSGVSDNGKAVASWHVKVTRGNKTEEMDLGGTLLSFVVPAGCTTVEINSVPPTDETSDAITLPKDEDNGRPIDVYDLYGRFCGTFPTFESATGYLNPGIYIMRQGKNVVKHVIR